MATKRRKTVLWDNTEDWEPSKCPECGFHNIRRFTIQTAQGTGKDSWLCPSCNTIIERKGSYKGKPSWRNV